MIEKYSHLATREEIRENDYNLNISRYVDTFEEEEEIDINAIATEIQAIDVDMKPLDESIRKYCTELSIKSPF